MPKILLVEDEKNFALVLRDYLRMNGYEVVHCENGEQGIDTFKKETFDLCIIDVMMPRKDGFSLTKEIRGQNSEVPLIFLTARSMRDDMVKGYKLGADDYIVKPFDSELLLLKIQAILNRKKNGQILLTQEEYEIGEFKFNARLRILKRKDQELKLSPKESALLNLLCQRRNDVLPRQLALKEIWKEDNYFTGRSMDVFIAKLRKYLSEDPQVEISNLHGNGYSLMVRM
jgi:two-component system, OmpR family, response regulator